MFSDFYINNNNNTSTSSAMNQVHQVVEGLYNNNNNNNNFLIGGSDFLVKQQHHMGEELDQDDSSTTRPTEPEPGSTSKEAEEGTNDGFNNTNNNNNWLQLSIGFHQTTVTTAETESRPNLELELLPINWASSSTSRPNFESVISATTTSSSFFDQQTASFSSSSSSSSFASMSMPSGSSFGYHYQPQHQPHQLAFGPLLHQHQHQHHQMPIMPFSSSIIPPSSSLRPNSFGSYYHHQHPHAQLFHFPSSSSGSVDVAGPSNASHVTVVRVVDPPRRPHSGIWFMLQASQNQGKEPFLPQIPKNYLRIKDGRMTVRLLFKYLVSKLKLESQSEIEITCRGQQLLPFLTLQHVRDNIWTPRDTTRALLSESSTTDHVMVLHYGRSTN